MLSIQHIVNSVYTSGNNEEYLDRTLSSKVYPDAIRAYVGDRASTHFETWSCLAYPMSTKATKEQVLALPKNVQSTPSCVLGEDTNLELFYVTNQHLPDNMREGIEAHLKEDIVFDAFVREHIDCSDKYNDVFRFQGETLDGKGVRNLIAQIEQQGYYHLACQTYETTGVLCDQDWFENTIKPVLERDYPEDLAANTFRYMKIHDQINTYIKNKDWSHLAEGPLPSSAYEKLYGDVSAYVRSNMRTQDLQSRFADVLDADLSSEPEFAL